MLRSSTRSLPALLAVALLAAATLRPTPAHGQAFNLDIDCEDGSGPPLGTGVPTSAFGAAAAQPGVWNLLDGRSTLATPLVGLAAGAVARRRGRAA